MLLYDYSLGDTVKLPTYVSLKRVSSGVYQVDANIGFSITFPITGSATFTPEGVTPIDLTGSILTGTTTVSISTTQLKEKGKGLLKLQSV